MKVTIERSSGCRHILGIEVPADRMSEDYKKVVHSYQSEARVPGFRKGKAPADVVEKRFGKNIVEDAKEHLVPKFYQEAVEQEDVKVAAVVGVDDVELGKASGLAFKVHVDLVPGFKLPKYKKISLKAQPVDVSDEDVEKAQSDMLERYSRYEDIDGRPVALGDLVQVDYRGTSDGKPLEEIAPSCQDLGEGTDFWIPTGESEFLPGFNAAIVGQSCGDSVSVDVVFPDDFHTEEVRGRTAVYEVAIKALREMRKPDLDETFLKNFDVTSEEELKEMIRKSLVDAAEAKETSRQRDEIAEFLLAKTSMDIPEAVVAREANAIMRSMIEGAVRQGAQKEEVHQRMEQITASAQEAGAKRVKLSYIAAEIAKVEELSVTEEDVDGHITAMAARYGMTGDQLRAELEKRETIDDLRSDVLSDKVFGFLLENAKIKG